MISETFWQRDTTVTVGWFVGHILHSAICGFVTHGLQRLRLAMNNLIKGTAFSGRDSNLTPHPTPNTNQKSYGSGNLVQTSGMFIVFIVFKNKLLSGLFNSDSIDF